jgi:sigma-E factor negative regulatory protein RseC
MAEMKQIEHEAIVVESLNNHTTIRIVSQSACAACHAKSACTAADLQEKLIDVVSPESFIPGQQVMLIGNQELGLKAAWWAYVLPVILVLATLIISFAITQQENLSGLLALLILIPYFFIIKLANNQMQKTFSFQIKSINE